MKSVISLLLCASIMSDANAINISADKQHHKNVCYASEFGPSTQASKSLTQKKNQTKKSSQIIENYVPEGDMANKDSKTQKIDLEKKFNPMYDGKEEKSVGKNVDLPKELQDKDQGPPKTPKEASEDLFKEQAQGKQLSDKQLEKDQKTNYFNDALVFQPSQNSQISKVLTGEELMKTTVGKTTIEMKPNSKEGAPFQNFVMVYNPGCKHCEEMKPEWSKLAEHVNKSGMNINMIAINDGQNDARKKLPGNIGEVDYYPAVFLFKNDKEQSAIEMNPEKDLGKQEDKKDSHAQAEADETIPFNYDGLMKFLSINGVKDAKK